MILQKKKYIHLLTQEQKTGYEKIDQILLGTFQDLDELYKSKNLITGLATGFTDFDKKTTGLKGSSLIILAARPRNGEICFGT